MLNHQLMEQIMNCKLGIFNHKKAQIRPHFSSIMQTLATGFPMKEIVDAFKASGLEISSTMLKAILKALEKEPPNAEIQGPTHPVAPVHKKTVQHPPAHNAVPPVTGRPGHAPTYGRAPFGPLSTAGLAGMGPGQNDSPFGQGSGPTYFNPNQMSYPGASSQSTYASI